MELWSSQDAARALRLTPRRIRALARAGRLKAHKVGNRWLVEPTTAREPRHGRPPTPAIGWAILAVLSGERPNWLHPSALSRLKRWMRSTEWTIEALKRSKARARIVRLRALPSDIPKILKKPGMVRTGLSAITDEVDLVPSSGEIDAYVSNDVLRMIERQFKPARESDQPNLTLRLPNQAWILKFKRAPLAVVCADLLLSADPRVVRAGVEGLKKVLHD
jgi:Helix-turn-helix domain